MATFTPSDVNIPAETFGGRVRRLRLERNWDQASLARKISSNPTNVSHLESDRYMPSSTRLIRLARVLAVCPAYLVTGVACDEGIS